jgi:hypothetical protein
VTATFRWPCGLLKTDEPLNWLLLLENCKPPGAIGRTMRTEDCNT